MSDLPGILLGLSLPVFFTALFGGSIAVALWSVSQRHKRLSTLASDWGLHASGNAIYGRFDGATVRLTHRPGGKNRPTRELLELSLPGLEGLLSFRPESVLDGLAEVFGTPEIQVGEPAVDDQWRIHGDAEVAREVLLDPAVVDALARYGGEGTFDGRTFSFRRRGRVDAGSFELLQWSAALARAVEVARCRPWRVFAERHALSVNESATEIRGRLGGFEVVIGEERSDDLVHTVVRVRLPSTLPKGTALRAGDEGVTLGDPILDGRVAAHGDPEFLRGLLCHDEARAAVMAVIHANPESEVTENEVVLRARGRRMAGLAETVDDAVSLARLLAQRAGSRRGEAERRPRPEKQRT
ncbi:MAG: hypothetical protein EP330_16195 [Deltaproteobacteria bacterium]|nr:MAG: hypothetical protein EP330_16195 [Deltaproteobacteria bacterium]